jgi:hypothetical protein
MTCAGFRAPTGLDHRALALLPTWRPGTFMADSVALAANAIGSDNEGTRTPQGTTMGLRGEGYTRVRSDAVWSGDRRRPSASEKSEPTEGLFHLFRLLSRSKVSRLDLAPVE